MTMEMIKEGANGQMEFDFDSLEALTSSEFVAQVRYKLEGLEVMNVKVNKRENGEVTILIVAHEDHHYEYGICGFYDAKFTKYSSVQKYDLWLAEKFLQMRKEV
jgi:hypothetical protein